MKKHWISFLVILGLAFFLRVYRLDQNLPTLYSDEVDLHYKSLIWLDLSQNYLYNHLFYGTWSFTWLFGLTPLGVRLPSAFFTTVAVAISFFWGRQLAEKLKLPVLAGGLLTMFLFAVAPWSLLMSRIGFTHIALMLVFLMIHFILFIKAKSLKEYYFSLIPLGLSVYYYQSMFLVAPFVLLLIGWLSWNKNLRSKITFVGVSLLFFVAMGIIFWFKPNYSDVSVGARGLDLAVWRDVNVTAETNIYRGLARTSDPSIFSFGLPAEDIGNKLNYSYPMAVLNVVSQNYLSFFNPDFLFLKGSPVLRHSTGQVGVLYPYLLPFLLVGAFEFFRTKETKLKIMFTVWILTTPLATSLTKDGFQDLNRVISMMPFLTFFCVVGLIKSYQYLRRPWGTAYLLGTTAVSVFSLYYFLFGFFHVYPAVAAKDYEYGFKELSDFQMMHENQSMLVIWDGYYPHWHFRFWQKTPSASFYSFKPLTTKIKDVEVHQQFDNLYFALPQSDLQLQEIVQTDKPSLIAVPIQYLNRFPQIYSYLRPIESVYYPDSSLDFIIFLGNNALLTKR